MKAQLMTLDDYGKLYDAIRNGDEQAANMAIGEIGRLSDIIKDYEIVLEMASFKMQNASKTKPLSNK